MENGTDAGEMRELRLLQLERRTRGLRSAVTVLAAAFVGALGLGAAAAPLVPSLLAAQTFRLVDGEGVVRGVLETDTEGRVSLSLMTETGERATSLVLSAQEPRLAVVDAEGSALAVAPTTDRDGAPSPQAEPGAKTKPQGATIHWGDPDEDDEAFDWVD